MLCDDDSEDENGSATQIVHRQNSRPGMLCGEADSDSDSDSDSDNELPQLLVIGCPQLPVKEKCLKTTEENVLMYISGYVAKKFMSNVSDQCNTSLTGSLTGAESEMLLLNNSLLIAKPVLDWLSQANS